MPPEARMGITRRQSHPARPPRRKPCIRKMGIGSLLCRTRSAQTPVKRGDGPRFHTSHQLCTGVFRPPVGNVGNQHRVTAHPGVISKTPQFHRRDLENETNAQTPSTHAYRRVIHFSCFPTGVTVFFFYLTPLFLTTRQTPASSM